MNINLNMKTIEEMKTAVLAYCEAVCPRNGHQHPLYEGAYLRGDIDGYGIYHYWGGLKGGNSTCICSISTRSASVQVAEFSAFYSLLGLEARDAVEAKNAELAESEIAFERQANILQAERARAAKLVEALEKIKNACRIAVTTRDFQEKGTIYKIENCIDFALEAHKKGGVQTNNGASTLTQSQQSRIAEVRLAYGRIRTIDQTIYDDILDLMENAAIAAIESEVDNVQDHDALYRQQLDALNKTIQSLSSEIALRDEIIKNCREALQAERARPTELVRFAEEVAKLFEGKGLGDNAKKALTSYYGIKKGGVQG